MEGVTSFDDGNRHSFCVDSKARLSHPGRKSVVRSAFRTSKGVYRCFLESKDVSVTHKCRVLEKSSVIV